MSHEINGRVNTLRQSLPKGEALSFRQRHQLGRVVKEWFGSRTVQVYDMNGQFEVKVEPPVRREELEETVGQFVANREYIHRPYDAIATDR